jgi:uncharacterized membrane protein YbjE (DUF340 family)
MKKYILILFIIPLLVKGHRFKAVNIGGVGVWVRL